MLQASFRVCNTLRYSYYKMWQISVYHRLLPVVIMTITMLKLHVKSCIGIVVGQLDFVFNDTRKKSCQAYKFVYKWV